MRIYSLDHLANNIASATFDVINAGKVRTADMGGAYNRCGIEGVDLVSQVCAIGSATTSEFTAAVIKNLS